VLGLFAAICRFPIHIPTQILRSKTVLVIHFFSEFVISVVLENS